MRLKLWARAVSALVAGVLFGGLVGLTGGAASAEVNAEVGTRCNTLYWYGAPSEVGSEEDCKQDVGDISQLSIASSSGASSSDPGDSRAESKLDRAATRNNEQG